MRLKLYNNNKYHSNKRVAKKLKDGEIKLSNYIILIPFPSSHQFWIIIFAICIPNVSIQICNKKRDDSDRMRVNS